MHDRGTGLQSCVRAEKAEGIEFNDSQIRSVLNKVRKTSEGRKPQIPNASPRDKALAGLHGDLLKVRDGISLEDPDGSREPLPTKLWVLCLRTVEESSSGTPPDGSRGYQDFLHTFLAKAG